MSKEVLTHSERYVRKTNRIILIIGFIATCVFLFGLLLLGTDPEEEQAHYEIERSIDEEANIGATPEITAESQVVFDDSETDESPITLTPNPINIGQVVLGNEASNVLTIGTNGKKSIKIISVELEDAPFDGFTFETNCEDKILRGKITCIVTMKWTPTVAENVQNNFKIIWHETNVSDESAKHDEVPVFGNAVSKEDCNFCDTGSLNSGSGNHRVEYDTIKGKNRYAVGPDGKIIGNIGEDGIVRDSNGIEIGRVNADGMIVDKDGNIIGVAANGKMILDENGNVVGYVDESGIAHDNEGNVIGTVLADGTVVDANGKVLGKAVDYGYVYDDSGNIIGRVMSDGSVIDLDGNIIGKVDGDGKVVDTFGNIIGHVAKAGEVAVDENGNHLGVVMPNGDVVDENGDVVGRMLEDGTVVTSQFIGKRDATARMAVDKDGNIIGYIDENGNVRDFRGNIVGTVDKDGNITDANGNIVGRVSDEWRDLALDASGNVIGYIDKEGMVHNDDGEIIGYVDENGNIIGNPKGGRSGLKVGDNGKIIDASGNEVGIISDDGSVFDLDGDFLGYVDENNNVITDSGDDDSKVIGSIGREATLAVDENGNIIGYIDENGNVIDENGNIIGHTDENGNIIDGNGNIIGHSDKRLNLAIGKDGRIIGHIDEKGVVRDRKGRISGIADVKGNIRSFGVKVIGSAVKRDLLPITPAGTLLGTINNRGEVVSQQKVVGKIRPDGLVTDTSGNKILAKGLSAGYIVNWGCDFNSKLDKDGIVRRDGVETDNRIYADGTVWTSAGEFAGRLMMTGKVYDNNCNYVGTAAADGYVRDIDNNEIGCLNPDGTVLDLEEPKIKGHLVEQRLVISGKSMRPLGVLEADGKLRADDGELLGCMDNYGDIYDGNKSYIGTISKAKYAFGFDGKYLGSFNDKGELKLVGYDNPHVIMNNLIADGRHRIIGYAAPEVNILIDTEGKKLGHLFPDGKVYDENGAVLDKFNGGSTGYYNGKIGTILQPLPVVDADGNLLGKVNYDLKVVDYKGAVAGKVNGKGQMFDEHGRLVGGIIKQGGVRGYDGTYLGNVVSTGEVIESENVDGSSGSFTKGQVTGKIVPDGHIIKDKKIIGEVLPYGIMVDVFGNQVGLSNTQGAVIAPNGDVVSVLLPGGGNNNNFVAMQTGAVIDYSGDVIGVVLPTGEYMDNRHLVSGRALADGKVISSDGNFLGEVVTGDIVIGNDDKVKGYVGFDGTIMLNGREIGKTLTDGLAVDKQGNILGHIYTIGNNILSNNGNYIGRLASNGRVIADGNQEIGYLKSNGSFVDIDKNVAGYSLPEVARNRRN